VTGVADVSVTEIAVISLTRAAKERSIDDLTHLGNAITAGTYRVSKHYEVSVVADADNKATALRYGPKPTAIENTEALYGAYVIETNQEGLSNEEIWHLSMTLTRVEEAFSSPQERSWPSSPLSPTGSAHVCTSLYLRTCLSPLWGHRLGTHNQDRYQTSLDDSCPARYPCQSHRHLDR